MCRKEILNFLFIDLNRHDYIPEINEWPTE